MFIEGCNIKLISYHHRFYHNEVSRKTTEKQTSLLSVPRKLFLFNILLHCQRKLWLCIDLFAILILYFAFTKPSIVDIYYI